MHENMATVRKKLLKHNSPYQDIGQAASQRRH